MAEVASYCMHCGAKIEPNSKFCPSCGKNTTLSAQGKTTSGAGMGKGTQKGRPSSAWYLLPIFLGFMPTL